MSPRGRPHTCCRPGAVRNPYGRGGPSSIPPGALPTPHGDRTHLAAKPDHAFSPTCGPENTLQELRLVLDGMTGTIPTSPAARSMRAENGAPDNETVH